MAMPEQDRMPIGEAIEVVGKALFPTDWIEPLNAKELRLIAYHVDGIEASSSSIIPAQTRHIVGGQTWAKYPENAETRALIEDALSRRNWKADQDEKALDWLDEHGFDSEAAYIDRDAVVQMVARKFRFVSDNGATTAVPKLGKPISEKSAKKITRDYLANEAKSGGNPTSGGLIEYAKGEGYRGGRQLLRTEFKLQQGTNFKGRGRPPKKSPN